VAIATYTDHSTQNLTSSVTWTSSKPVASISNATSSNGLATSPITGTTGTTNIVAAIGTIMSPLDTLTVSTPTWTATGSLTTARTYHTATLLPNGTVLVAAGSGLNGFLSSAEIY
jgi:Galactose oxidase, central domain